MKDELEGVVYDAVKMFFFSSVVQGQQVSKHVGHQEHNNLWLPCWDNKWLYLLILTAPWVRVPVRTKPNN